MYGLANSTVMRVWKQDTSVKQADISKAKFDNPDLLLYFPFDNNLLAPLL